MTRVPLLNGVERAQQLGPRDHAILKLWSALTHIDDSYARTLVRSAITYLAEVRP